MFPLTEWIDGDDVTEEDLFGPLTAEEEVFDMISDTPLPELRRPEWLPEYAWEPRLQRRRRGIPARSRGIAWGWVAGSLVVAALVLLSIMASAVGVAFVALV